MIPDNPTSIGQPFISLPKDIVATVLDITVKGWSQVLSNGEVNSESEEPDIAGFLIQAMLSEKKRRAIGNIRIEEEVGTRTPLKPKPDGRIDVKIIYSFIEEEYFGMECKRIDDKDNDLTNKYVAEGVMRFVNGKYSAGHECGAMLGFVIDGRVAACVNRISKQMKKKKKETQEINSWKREKSFGEYQDLYHTSHQQKSNSTIISILHIFLSIN